MVAPGGESAGWATVCRAMEAVEVAEVVGLVVAVVVERAMGPAAAEAVATSTEATRDTSVEVHLLGADRWKR